MKSLAIKWLKKSEQYTKTDMVYLVGQSGWLFVGQGAIFLSALLLAWVFANYVEPSDYGLYKFVLSVATIATLTSLAGFGIAISRGTTQGFEVNLNKLVKIQIRYGVLGAVLLFVFALYYLHKDNTLLATLFAVTAVWVPFFESFGNYQFLLQGKKDFKTQTYLRISQRLLLSLTVVSVILLTNNIVLITLSYFTILTLTQLLVYLYTVKKYPGTKDENTPYDSIISYGKKVSFQNIFYVGANQLDKILLFKFLGPTQLAIYFFATALPNEIQGVVGNINAVAFPKLVDKSSPEFKWALVKKMALSTLVLAVPAGAYIVAAPYIFTFLFPVYMDSILISQLYIGTILFIPANLFWLYFYATEHQKALWYGTFIVPTSLIVGIVLFVPTMGLLGAVLATYLRGVIEFSLGLFFFLHAPKKELS